MRAVLVTKPKIEPVSVDEVMLHARIDDVDEGAKVQPFIKAARELAENYTRRAFLAQTWRAFLDAFPACRTIEIPRGPLMSVTHVKTYDDADADTTFAASNYFVDTASVPGRLVLRDAASWPDVARVANGVEIEFVAGYAEAAADVPFEIKQAILLTVTHLYEHRGDESMDLPETAKALLRDHKTWLV